MPQYDGLAIIQNSPLSIKLATEAIMNGRAIQSGICVFCGKGPERGEMTSEHFVPKCLWGDMDRHSDTGTVPAHAVCNKSMSEVNDYFRFALLHLKELKENPLARQVMLGPVVRLAKNEGRLNKVAGGIEMRPHEELGGASVKSFLFDRDRFSQPLNQLVRGLYYYLAGNPMPEDHAVDAYFHDEIGDEFLDLVILPKMGERRDFGDNVFSYRYYFFNGFLACDFCFYGSINFVGLTRHKSLRPLHDDATAEAV